jgi:putative phage-type endonuclease
MTALAQRFDQDERRTYLGASEIAAAIGLDKYRTPLDLYREKVGEATPFEGNKHTLRGTRLEQIAAEYYTEITGLKLRRSTRDYIHPNGFIRGHIDRIIEGQQKLAEIKCPSIAAYRKIQREGLPTSYLLQLQIYLGLSEYKKGVFIVFCADAFDIAHFEIDFDKEIYTSAIAGAVKFWNNVVTRTPPAAEPSEKDAAVELTRIGGSVTFRDDESFLSKAQTLREATQLRKDGEELYELAKQEMLEEIEREPGCYEGGGVRIHYSQRSGRKTFNKKRLAADYPQIPLSNYEDVGSPYNEFRTYITKGE